MKKLIRVSALLSLMLSSTLLANEQVSGDATIQQPSSKGLYVGGGYGTFDAFAGNDWDNSYRYGRLVEKISGNTSKLYIGYSFNRIISVEASYSDYGETLGFVYSLIGRQSVYQEPTSFSVAANAGYSFDNGWRAFGILGLSSVELNSSFDYLETDNPVAIKWGFGGEYTPAGLKGLQFRIAFEADTYFAESENYFNSDSDLYAFSLTSAYIGASYKF
ncbi:MAG: hypothetical protein ACPGTQ_00295 [Colwellia sp.]